MWLLALAFWRVNGGGSGSPDALLPLKSDFRLNPNDLTRKESAYVPFKANLRALS